MSAVKVSGRRRARGPARLRPHRQPTRAARGQRPSAAYGAYLLLTRLVPDAGRARRAAACRRVRAACSRSDATTGMSGDQLALAVGRFCVRPKRQLLAPDGLPAPLARARPRHAPRRSTSRSGASSAIGLVELADGSHCLLLDARGTSFELRSPVEQTAFVDCFARFLNSRRGAGPAHVRSEPASLTPHAARLEAAADGLPPRAAAGRAGARRLPPLARARVAASCGGESCSCSARRERDPELASAASPGKRPRRHRSSLGAERRAPPPRR